ncbi:twin-arginine translocation signal domain-containing protein, partial [bacterium]|nr:twin-arginine translocation signal domain-containing protein [bacterium]
MKMRKGNQEKIVKTLNRRDFIKTASLAATAAAASPALFGPFSIITRQAHAQPGQTDQIKVIVARDEGTAQGS